MAAKSDLEKTRALLNLVPNLLTNGILPFHHPRAPLVGLSWHNDVMYGIFIFQAMAGSIPPLVSSSPPPLCSYDDDDEEDEDVFGVYAVAEELDYNGKLDYLCTLLSLIRSKRDILRSDQSSRE